MYSLSRIIWEVGILVGLELEGGRRLAGKMWLCTDELYRYTLNIQSLR